MIRLRTLTLKDLEAYQYWQLPHHKYHTLNGPYFVKESAVEVEVRMTQLREALLNGTNIAHKKIISNEFDAVIGEVSWYWKSQETFWLEIGIIIFDEQYWGQGIGFSALRLWIAEIFAEKENIVRLGLTTWSGNIGMMKLAEKLGMKKEAEYRKARIVAGKYYDSVSYGILKSEWLEQEKHL
ncbi:GNAT family N-acetyltransferase [Aureispira anguillae]|uniref:GNAT family N-acetyltransferase n=1 Tax=Aureispira anguillae TaxID=2864201 RepID=A0A915YEG5_9BACT|nr:GNAT family protein [Aureispira anguillae]BDS11630.1 GNAT family N-acetyltransferase [Aureispira anguillae]